jgi:hypothetical protein
LSEQGRVDRHARLDQTTAGLFHTLDEVGREERRGEGQEIERDEEEFVEEAENEQDGLEQKLVSFVSFHGWGLVCVDTNLVGIVQVQKPALALVDILVARVGTANNQGSVHVHVVAGEVECNQALEDDGPSRKGRGQEDQQA